MYNDSHSDTSCIPVLLHNLTFRIIVHVYDHLFQRNFPLYTALFGTVWLLILGICHSIRTLFGPLFPWVHHFCMHYWENPLSKSFSKREICRYSLQEKKSSLYHLEFVSSPTKALGSLLISGDVSTLYYYSTLLYCVPVVLGLIVRSTARLNTLSSGLSVVGLSAIAILVCFLGFFIFATSFKCMWTNQTTTRTYGEQPKYVCVDWWWWM